MERRAKSSSFVSAASLIPSDYKVPDWKLNFLGHDEIWSAKVAIHGCGFRLDKSFASERRPIIYRVLLPGSDRARRRSSTRRASRTRAVHGNTSAAKTSDRLLLFVYLKNIFRSVRFDYGSRVILCENARHDAITKIYET